MFTQVTQWHKRQQIRQIDNAICQTYKTAFRVNNIGDDASVSIEMFML